jgi:transcriptional regulator with XRE-family HTH domain
MKSRKIKAWLLIHGITQAQIALDLDVSKPVVSMFISGKKTSRRLYLYFVAELGVPRSYFGDKYNEEEAA